MKKRTDLQTAPGEARPKPAKRTGPAKEKTQITVRIDQQLMASVYTQIKDDNVRITDMIERGLMLALGEARHQLPAWSKQIRFVLANATAQQTQLIRGLAIAMVENEIEPRHPAEELIWNLIDEFLAGRNRLPHSGKCLELYSRYGKSAEEIARLG